MKTLVVFLIVFSVVVVIHEFGHFFFAKRAGILVREFSIGMGPKLFSHQAKDGTTYTVRWLPMGGYVRMAGNEEEEELKPGMPVSLVLNESDQVEKINTSNKVQLTNSIPMEVAASDLVDALTITGFINGDDSQAVTYAVMHDATIIEEDGIEVRIAPRDVQFQSAKLWQRMLTNFAGPMNNFILSILLFIALVFAQGGVVDNDSTVVSSVSADSGAEQAGLLAGDKILAINDQAVSNWPEVREIIQENPDKTVPIKIDRQGETLTVEATIDATESNGETYGQLGVTVPLKTGFWDKVVGGIQQSYDMFIGIFKALGQLITNFSLDQLGGPVAIAQMSSEAAKQGPITVLYLTAMLSVNLGIMNLLPIPGLDGGKLFLNIIEGLRGKPISQEKEGIITLIGFGLLMLVMVLVTWNDIQRFFF